MREREREEREREREKRERERERRERTNERTNEFFYINEGKGISTILFFIQPSGEMKNFFSSFLNRKQERERERERESYVK